MTSNGDKSFCLCGVNLSDFKEITLKGKFKWIPSAQLAFHMQTKCARFSFLPQNYLFFRPVYQPSFIEIIPYLSKDVNNVSMVYTGRTEKSGIIRAINQLFKLHHNYSEKEKGKDHDEFLADVYQKTVKSKSGCIGLLVIRESDDFNEIKKSEFSSNNNIIY